MKYSKYHALGNDYIVIDPNDVEGELDGEKIRLICHRNYGVGSDGILLGPIASRSCDFKLRIFNPDGGEAEKSGNGLRIFSRYLWDRALVREHSFTIETAGGPVTAQVLPETGQVTVQMGQVHFHSDRIPVSGEPREVINERIEAGGKVFIYCAATIGNPHCVVCSETPSAELAKQYGRLIETDPRFPERTNVQFMEVLDRQNIRIEIWERGAGYTLASGSSSTAAAAVALKLGLCDSKIRVHMPGGSLQIEFKEGFWAIMTGPVIRICDGNLDQEMFARTS
ncbi:MAG: diaminopimelate epimerase [Desulfobacteraceae bacterium]|nr:MAG: diaminopimelate epimerase [Desulfobacteraceae bacterium]